MAEAGMSSIPCRGWIALAGALLALFASRGADAQVVVPPGAIPPPTEHFGSGPLSDLIIGANFELMDQAHAERKLCHLEAKLQRDAARGDWAAVERDRCQIDRLRYRISVDEWLIRKNRLQPPGYYRTWTDPLTATYIADAARPSPA